MMASAAYLYLAPLLPAAETYRDVQLETPLRIYTSGNQLIEEIGNRRNPVSYDEIPKVLTDALIATEDERFYSHLGVDIRSLARGFYGFMTGSSLGGGSTIAMQLANNLSFDSDNVYLRKFKEIPFAIQIHQELEREEILELYLNLIYFGAGAEGIGAAAFVYYGKRPDELTLAEAAMMISVLPCPSACNPLADPQRAVERREIRLRNMLNQDMISRVQYETANRAPVTARRHGRDAETSAPWVAEMVRQQLVEQYGEAAYSGGFEVITSIDNELQQAANRALIDGLEIYYDKRHGYRGAEAHYPPDGVEPNSAWLRQLQTVRAYGNQIPAIVIEVAGRQFTALLKSGEEITVGWDGIAWASTFRDRDEAWPPPDSADDVVRVGDLIRVKRGAQQWELGQLPEIQGALVSLSPQDGAITTLVGGYDYSLSQVNRVTAPRPPGSNFKPFVYGAALEHGYSAASQINDAPLIRGSYRPNNYENNFLGPITLRYALQQSRNVPTVRLYEQLGASKVLEFAGKLGFPVQNFPRNDLTVALGSQDVRPLEMVAAYAILANGGYKVEPWLIREIRNLADGQIYVANPVQVCESDCDAVSVVDSRVAFILNSMLRSVIVEGSGARVQRELQRNDLMGKTGTTNGPRELWFSGFNRNIATSVFVGLDQPEALGEREQGATVAVPIWIDFMREALREMPESTIPRPGGVVDRLINKSTGQLATPGEPDTMFELFLVENDPGGDQPLTPSIDPEDDDSEELSTETIF
ncbi:MAG: penicillin-binding protein 1A [Pseudohongiellaceae bacterium]